MRYCFFASLVVFLAACGGARLAEIQRVKSGDLDVVLLSPRDAITHGQDSFVIEFRKADGSLVDVGEVKGSATMPMPGSPMFGSLDVGRSAVAGRYDAEIKADMAGTWRITLEWSGAAGRGTVSFSGNVQ